MKTEPKPKRLVRKCEAMKRIGLQRSAFDEAIVKPGRLRFFKVGKRSCACFEHELELLMEKMAAAAE